MSHALASNSEEFYFSPNFDQLLEKVTKFGEIGPRTKSYRQKAKLGDGKQPSPPQSLWG